jgi:hypothetical protein
MLPSRHGRHAATEFTPRCTLRSSPNKVADLHCNVNAHRLQQAQALISQLQAQNKSEAVQYVPLTTAAKAVNSDFLQQVSVLASL